MPCNLRYVVLVFLHRTIPLVKMPIGKEGDSEGTEHGSGGQS